MIRIRTLGVLRADRDGQPLSLRRKDVLLLAYIALHERPVTRTAAATLMWGESTDHAARLSLRQAVWRLRNETGDVIISTTTALAIDRSMLSIDVSELDDHVDAGRYREAAKLFEGDFLDGADSGVTAEFEHWADAVRGRVRQRMGLVRQQLVRDAVRNGDWTLAAEQAANWCREAPEDATAALERARALRAGGRAAEALAGLTAFSGDRAISLNTTARADVEQLTQALRQEASRVAPVSDVTHHKEDPHLRLVSMWERCVFGRSAAVLIRGHVSECARLHHAFVEWVEARGASTVILRMTAVESDASRAWRGIRNLIDGLRSAPGVGGAADDAVAQLAGWCPSLHDRFPRIAVVEAKPDGVEDALRRVVDAVAEEATVLISVENAHWCDAESAAVIASLVQRLPARVLLMLTADDTEQSETWAEIIDPSNIITLPRRSNTRRKLIAASVMLACATVVTGAFLRARTTAASASPVAVGIIQVVGERDTLSLSAAVPGLLATKLGLIEGLELLSSARMHEMVAQLGSGNGDSAATLSAAARRAGAKTLIEGELYRQNGEMRLALRRVRVATGKVESSFETSNTNVFTLVDEIADQIARSYNLELPRQRIAGATTTSIVAYKFYEEGLRAYYQNDRPAAFRDFMAALNEDSTFAMAAFYASQSDVPPDLSLRLFQRAVRLARSAGDRDRLLIQAQWAVRNGTKNLFAIADTLTVRYPHDPDGHYYYGVASEADGKYADAARHYQQALTLDSLALLGRSVPCRACAAIASLVGVYEAQDSMRLAEQVAHKWVQLQPWSLNAWTSLGSVLEFQNRFAAAESAFVHAESVQPALSDLTGHLFEIALRIGNFRATDSIIALGLHSEDEGTRADARFRSLLSLRAQGRMREAFVLATDLRLSEPDSISMTGASAQLARALMEVGRYTQAAALFDSTARFVIRSSPPREAHGVAGFLTNEAVALAAARDTSRLAAIEKEVAYYGGMSAQIRDRTLHDYVHGLRQQLAGDLDGAILSFRRASFSPTFGNVRASLSLGQALIDQNRPAEAIRVLDAAIRGALGASGTPVPKAELHEAIGRAYEARGDRARAAVEYAWVLNAWRNADPAYAARREQLQQRLRRLRMPG